MVKITSAKFEAIWWDRCGENNIPSLHIFDVAQHDQTSAKMDPLGPTSFVSVIIIDAVDARTCRMALFTMQLPVFIVQRTVITASHKYHSIQHNNFTIDAHGKYCSNQYISY